MSRIFLGVALAVCVTASWAPGRASADEGMADALRVPLSYRAPDRSGLGEAWLTRPLLAGTYGAMLFAEVCCALPSIIGGLGTVGLEVLTLSLLSASDFRLTGGDISMVNHLTVIGSVAGGLIFVSAEDTLFGFALGLGAIGGSLLGVGLTWLLEPTPAMAGFMGIGAVLGSLAGLGPGLAIDDAAGTDPRATAFVTLLGLASGSLLGAIAGTFVPFGRQRIQFIQLGMGLSAGLAGFFLGIAFAPAGIVWAVISGATVLGAGLGALVSASGRWDRLAEVAGAVDGVGVVALDTGWAPVVGGRF